MAAEEEAPSMAQQIMNLVDDIAASISGATSGLLFFKKDCAQLVRRLKLIVPLLEEVRDLKSDLPEAAVEGIQALAAATLNAKQLVSLCQAGPKLYLVLEKDAVSTRFQAIAAELAQSIDRIPLAQLDVSDEVREQVDLVHSQLKRVKAFPTTQQETRLREDVVTAVSRSPDEVDQTCLQRLADHLQLKSFADLKKENQALLNIKSEDMKEGQVCKLMEVVKVLKGIAVADSRSETHSLEMARLAVGSVEKSQSAAIPDDFRCPISLELMKDPVIVATGQTYERTCIQKWLDAGHKTCPKTQQVLPHLVLTPNYVLRSLIMQWCENNGVDLPKRLNSSRGVKNQGCAEVSASERALIDTLVQKLASGQPDVQKAAAGEIRLLAKRSAENRVCIAEAGAIPLLVSLLATKDQRTQEHAVTALLNLSINDNNKAPIVMLGAIDPIVEVLRIGCMEARENAAATLFSLSVVDENKITIGASGAIPALVDLLREGTSRGKKDAATALFNLSIYQGNKARAVRAGVVPQLMELLVDQSIGMVDESLAILAILATHQEGRLAIGQEGAVPVLVELIKSGSSRNKENAAAVLHALSLNDAAHLVAAQQLGVYEPLAELLHSGTARARRKASSLLEHLSKTQEDQQLQQQQLQQQQQQQDVQQQQQQQQQQPQQPQQPQLQQQQQRQSVQQDQQQPEHAGL